MSIPNSRNLPSFGQKLADQEQTSFVHRPKQGREGVQAGKVRGGTKDTKNVSVQCVDWELVPSHVEAMKDFHTM